MRKLFVSFLLGSVVFVTGYGQNPTDSARYLYSEYQHEISSGNFTRSEILLEQILGLDHQLSVYQEALVRNALGFVKYERGLLTHSLEQYRIAEELAIATDPATLQLRISIYINLDLYYKSCGDYTNALAYNNEALRLLDLFPARDSLSLNKQSTLLLNKGITLFHLDRYDEALEVLKECARIKEEHGHPYLGSVYFNLARIYRVLEDAEQCHSYYLKSIEQWSTEYDRDYYELANIYLHFGQFLTAQGKPEQGKEYLQKALQNYKRNYGNIHPQTASAYEALARHNLDQSDYEEALKYLQLALHAAEGSFEEEDPFLNPDSETSRPSLTLLSILTTKTTALANIAATLTEADEKIKYLEAALATNILSREMLHQIRDTYLSTESRIHLNSNQKDLYTTGIRLNLELFKQTGLQLYGDEAFLTAAKGKSSELVFEMNRKEWLYLESLPDTAAIITTELKQQMDQLTNLIHTEEMKMNSDSARLANWQEQLFHMRDSFNKQIDELHQDLPQLLHFESASTDFTIELIRRNLKRKETLVEYFLGGPDSSGKEELFIFVLTKNECHVCLEPIDGIFYQNLETIIENLHGFVPYLETRERFDSLNNALFGIYQVAVHPVIQLLGGKKLIIVPDEMLAFIPFDALITRLGTDSFSNYAGASYLLNDYDISYLYNSQLIDHRHSRTWRFPDVTAWLPGNASASQAGFGNLDGAVEEVSDILELVNGRSIQESLTKQDLINLLQEPSILHLAMHTLATENQGSSPYFILDTMADPMLANQMHDYEISALHLSSPMVVLSSCQTAGGQLHRGEGIMSLSRSFLQAGAPSVVHSLWPVEDAKSRKIMVGFYRELKKGYAKSSALSRVKRQYLDQQPPFYTHPYYWAAFQVTGDSAAVHTRKYYILVAGSILLALLLLNYFIRPSFLRRD